MRWFRFAIFICFVTLVQAGILAYLNIKPDLLLIILVFFAIYCSTTDAVITSFAIGFAADIIGSSMGPQMISFGLFGTALAYLHRVVAIRKMPYQALAVFIMGVLAGVLAHLLTYLKGLPTTPEFHTFLFKTSVYSALAGPFLFLPIAWLMRIKTQRFTQQ